MQGGRQSQGTGFESDLQESGADGGKEDESDRSSLTANRNTITKLVCICYTIFLHCQLFKGLLICQRSG